MKQLCGSLLAIFLTLGQASGCGLSFSELPQTHFNGVEEHGYVSYWEKMGEVALDEKTLLTISFSFKSRQEASSPYLGKGWSIPFLESHIEPLDDNSFRILMPDGLLYEFGRTSPGSDIYSGSRGWIAQANGDTMTTWAPCGWKIIFQRGKIQQIVTPESKTVDYHYNGPVVMEIVEDGKILAKAESTNGAGITDLIIGDQKIDLTLGRRPHILTKIGQNLIIGFDQSLTALQWSDGRKETFIFGADNALNPTLNIRLSDQATRNFSWDPTTRQIRTDGEWTYKWNATKPDAIDRTNTQGQSQGYESNGATTVVRGIDGISNITVRFVNAGLLNGKVRSVIEEKNGITQTLHQYDYDEKGRLIRETRPGIDVMSYSYGSNSLRLPIQLEKNGQVVWTREFRSDGLIQTVTYPDKKETYIYPDDPNWGLQLSKLTGRTVLNKSDNVSTIVTEKGPGYKYTSYNNSIGKPVVEIFANNDLVKYDYNNKCQITHIYKNDKLITENTYNSAGILMKISRYSIVTNAMKEQIITDENGALSASK